MGIKTGSTFYVLCSAVEAVKRHSVAAHILALAHPPLRGDALTPTLSRRERESTKERGRGAGKAFGRWGCTAAALLLFLSGCTLAKVDVNVVSERTALENQVLGTYNALSEDVLLVASVRGVTPTGKVETPKKQSPEHGEALRALETIAFHADDVDALKRLGWVGENLEGTLTPFPREIPEKLPAELKGFAGRLGEGEFKQVLAEVNRSREILMLRVVQTNENFTAKDLPAVRRVFARINRQNSAPGTRVQEDDGRWANR